MKKCKFNKSPQPNTKRALSIHTPDCAKKNMNPSEPHRTMVTGGPCVGQPIIRVTGVTTRLVTTQVIPVSRPESGPGSINALTQRVSPQ